MRSAEKHVLSRNRPHGFSLSLISDASQPDTAFSLSLSNMKHALLEKSYCTNGRDNSFFPKSERPGNCEETFEDRIGICRRYYIDAPCERQEDIRAVNQKPEIEKRGRTWPCTHVEVPKQLDCCE